MTRFATILLLASLAVGCDLDFTQGFKDLLSIRNGVVKIVDTNNVSVNINNGNALTIHITNSALNTQTSDDRKQKADQVARIAYEKYANRQNLKAIYVVFSSHQKKFAIVDVTSTVESFQYSSGDIEKLSKSHNAEAPHRPNKALQPTPEAIVPPSAGHFPGGAAELVR